MKRRRQLDSPEIPIAPMIDCVFLMLVYFMTTSSLERSEADLPCPVNQPGLAADPLSAVDEQTVALTGEGAVLWNGSRFDILAGEDETASFKARLDAFQKTCRMAGSEPSLRLEPADSAPHQSLVTLLDAVTESGIETIHFP
jgi:biopolymer transport protein ExbD